MENDHLWCSYHQQLEPRSNFGKNAARANGLQTSCRAGNAEWSTLSKKGGHRVATDPVIPPEGLPPEPTALDVRYNFSNSSKKDPIDYTSYTADVKRHHDNVCPFTGAENLDGGLLEVAHTFARAYITKLFGQRRDHWKIDPANGFLTQPNIHKLYDRRYLAIDDHGRLLFSRAMTREQYLAYGLDPETVYQWPAELWTPRHANYARLHRLLIWHDRTHGVRDSLNFTTREEQQEAAA